MSRSPMVLLLLLGSSLAGACGARAPQVPAATPQAATPAVSVPAKPAQPSWDRSTAIGDVVAVQPESARLFELLDIDYCCGGKQTLAEAAKARGLKVERLIGTLHAMATEPGADRNESWVSAPLEDLVKHIVSTYHARLRTELPRLEALVTKVVRVHGEKHAELQEVGERFATLRKAIPPHLQLEEQRLFPAILAASPQNAAATRKLLQEMHADHDEVGGALHRIHELTGGYVPPEDACALYTQMLKGLAALERDLHAHVHLENNVLLPRALAALDG